MIHEILPADVEFAKGMIHASHSDAEILASLAARGIEPTKAAQLLEDLRHGRTPDVHLPYPPDALFREAAHRSPAAARHRAPPVPLPETQPHRRKHHRVRIPWWFVLLVVLFLVALGFAFFHTGRGVSRDAIQQNKHDLPPPPGK